MRQPRAAGMPVLSLMRSTSHGHDLCWCLDASLLECEGFLERSLVLSLISVVGLVWVLV